MPSSRTWLFLFLSGLATGLSWLCYFRALQLGPASRVAPIDKLSVALVIAASAIFLHERLTWGKAIGGMLIVAGAIVVALDLSRRERHSHASLGQRFRPRKRFSYPYFRVEFRR